jgi:hypothetical protein
MEILRATPNDLEATLNLAAAKYRHALLSKRMERMDAANPCDGAGVPLFTPLDPLIESLDQYICDLKSVGERDGRARNLIGWYYYHRGCVVVSFFLSFTLNVDYDRLFDYFFG